MSKVKGDCEDKCRLLSACQWFLANRQIRELLICDHVSLLGSKAFDKQTPIALLRLTDTSLGPCQITMPATRSPIPNANLHDDSVSTHKHTRKHRTVNSLERAYTDVILTIKPFFADLIRKREKNHEFRRYRLRAAVKRLWLYESTPTCAITYV